MNRFFTLLLAASCLTAVGQSEYCLDGTVWDATLGGCVPEVSACEVEFDFDGDSTVGSGDLLAFLGGFGDTIPDADGDGICDYEDTCVGELDECGVCNGPGPTEIVIENITILLDSVYTEISGWVVFEVGADTTFSYTCAPFFGDCGDPVSYQGYDYATVLIGEQCWFAENLRSENYENGDAIPVDVNDSQWFPTTSGATAVYGEGSSICSTTYTPEGNACDEAWSLNEFGRLYNWYAVDDSRGLCPSGWHVPTDGEWTVMTDFLGASEPGGQMKTTSGWHDGGNGTNLSGFSGLPGGNRDYTGGFGFAGYYGYWWSSSPNGTSAWCRVLYYENELVYRTSLFQPNGYSVRCVRDTE